MGDRKMSAAVYRNVLWRNIAKSMNEMEVVRTPNLTKLC